MPNADYERYRRRWSTSPLRTLIGPGDRSAGAVMERVVRANLRGHVGCDGDGRSA
jgi:hypothetical protein